MKLLRRPRLRLVLALAAVVGLSGCGGDPYACLQATSVGACL